MSNDPERPCSAWRFRRLESRKLQGVEVNVARGPVSRLLGLAFLDRRLAPGGLLIPRCRSVHTFGMRFSLDLIFLDREERPLVAVHEVPAGHRVRVPKASAVLEIPSALGGDR